MPGVSGDGLVLASFRDFANWSRRFGFGGLNEFADSQQITLCPFDFAFRVIGRVKAWNFVKQSKKLSGLVKVKLNKGSDGSSAPLGKGEESGSLGVREVRKGGWFGFFGRYAESIGTFKFHFCGNCIALDATRQSRREKNT